VLKCEDLISDWKTSIGSQRNAPVQIESTCTAQRAEGWEGGKEHLPKETSYYGQADKITNIE
jgi:hypothetical protein